MSEKYVIVPKIDFRTDAIVAESPEDAIIFFADTMDTDMHLYFQAIPEKELDDFIARYNQEVHDIVIIQFMENVLINDFDIPEELSNQYAIMAFNLYCEGDGKTEYECVEEIVSRGVN